MRKALLARFDDIVTINRHSRKIQVQLPGGTRFFFRYDAGAERWKEFLASRPAGIVSEDERRAACGLLNLYLYVLT